MAIFDNFAAFSAEEVVLMEAHMQPILQAAFGGLIRLVNYGNRANGEIDSLANSVSRLPDYPELKGRKYVELTTCLEGMEE